MRGNLMLKCLYWSISIFLMLLSCRVHRCIFVTGFMLKLWSINLHILVYFKFAHDLLPWLAGSRVPPERIAPSKCELWDFKISFICCSAEASQKQRCCFRVGSGTICRMAGCEAPERQRAEGKEGRGSWTDGRLALPGLNLFKCEDGVVLPSVVSLGIFFFLF